MHFCWVGEITTEEMCCYVIKDVLNPYFKACSPYKSEESQVCVCERVFQAFQIWLGLHIVVMITGIDFSQKNVCNRHAGSLKTTFGASSQACSAIVTTT